MTEWNPNEYSRHSSLQQAMAEEQLALLTLAGTERVLDVGCGVGNVTARVAARLPRGEVLGVDPSWDMISFANNLHTRAAHPNLCFEVADVRCLPYVNEFDLVISFNALHWVPEQETALRCIHTALKPGGRAMLRFVPEGPRRSLEDIIEDVRKSPAWQQYFPNYQQPFAHFTIDEYRTLAEKAGFTGINIVIKEKAWDFKTREAFAGFCRATFVEWSRLIPEERRPEFITAVLDHYRSVAADVPAEDNTFKFYQMEVGLIR